LPIIVYTGKDLSKTEEAELSSLSESIILKTADSPARLLEETTIFLHRLSGALKTNRIKVCCINDRAIIEAHLL